MWRSSVVSTSLGTSTSSSAASRSSRSRRRAMDGARNSASQSSRARAITRRCSSLSFVECASVAPSMKLIMYA
ncbi:hypothetical protein ACFSTC_22170 [Nonomuraea ferruginea]